VWVGRIGNRNRPSHRHRPNRNACEFTGKNNMVGEGGNRGRGALQGLETEGVLAGVGDVEESVLVLVLFVNGRHQRGGRWEHLVDEDEDGLLGGELDALADYVDELAYGEVGWDQVLLLVDRGDVGLLDLLADDGDAIAVFLADAFGLSLALLEGVLVLKLGSHID